MAISQCQCCYEVVAEEVEKVSDPSPDLVDVAVHLTTPHVLLTRSHLSLGLQVSGCG